MGLGVSSVFKSKDSFVSGFLSNDWDTATKLSSCPPRNNASTPQAVEDGDDSTTKTSAAAAADDVGSTSFAASKKNDYASYLKSQDWVECDTLGMHVEIPYSKNMFCSGDSWIPGSSSTMMEAPPSIRTDFSSPTTADDGAAGSTAAASATEPQATETTTKKKKKKRKRSPRVKKIPEVKKYCEPTNLDVLMGRGGRSNHHPGNQRYRKEIERVEEFYKSTDDKDEKTSISETLVLYVQSYGGNFLEKDEVDGTLSKIPSPGRKFLKRFAKTRIRRKEEPSANGSWRRERNSRTTEGRKRMLPKSKRINRRISTDDFVAIRNFFFRFASGLVDCIRLLKKKKRE